MSTWLVAFVGAVYAYVAIEQLVVGRWKMAMVWAGYSFAQVGLYLVTRDGQLG